MVGAVACAAVTVVLPVAAQAAKPPPPTSYPSTFQAVSCPPKGSCVAVGYYTNGSNVARSLVEMGSKRSWSVKPSANSGDGANRLFGVSCPSSKFCMAVGYYENADTQLALTEVWNGRSWSTISGVDPSATENYLQGVSCVSSSDCTAVGYYADDVTGNYSTLVEHWNGASWSQATSVNPSTSHNYLQGVSCVSGSDCTAVGYYVDAVDFTTTYSLIEHWNGTSWSQVASIDPSTVSNVLSGVSCVSSSDCTAAGHYSTTGSYVRSLIEHWNGASWTQKTGGDRANYDNNINAVSCPTSDYCAAVGYYPNYNPDISQDQTLIQSWNGTSWTLTDSPNVAPASGAYANQLKGVSCSSSNTCIAVGLYGSTSHHTLVEYWDGNSWQIVASPDATSA